MSVILAQVDVNRFVLIRFHFSVALVLLAIDYTMRNFVQVSTLILAGNYFLFCFLRLDINECSEGVFGCSQLCTNTIGSYTCTCHNGYQISNDNHTCTDIDECSINDNGKCEQTCSNTNGSYYCACLTGYSLDNNDHNCTGITRHL